MKTSTNQVQFSEKSPREREYLTTDETNKLIETAKQTGRHGKKDALMILIAYRHGLRASELVDLRWHQVHFDNGTLDIERSKNGKPSVHYLEGDELRALRQLKREAGSNAFIFTSERGGPFTTRAFQYIVEKAGNAAGFEFAVHPHMLRHAKGYNLANRGIDTRAIQDYLGHRNIQSTVRYTETSPIRFKGFGKDA